MGTLFEGFQILCTIFWEKGGIIFKGGHYIREDISTRVAKVVTVYDDLLTQ